MTADTSRDENPRERLGPETVTATLGGTRPVPSTASTPGAAAGSDPHPGSGSDPDPGSGTVADRTGPGRRPRFEGTRHVAAQLARFTGVQAMSCIFPVGVFTGLALARVVPLPIARYDALLLWCLALTAVCWTAGLETRQELLVIALFHGLGLALEVFKVRQGSWSYPGASTLAVGGVPAFSGFMYAAVGSYVCQAWRRFELRLSGYRAWWTAAAAVAVYVNFFTHHYLPDLRVLLAAALVLVLWPCRVHFTVGAERYRMPLAASFVLIGVFLWLAENAATLLSAWRYPDQYDMWRMVHTEKLGSWALLVSVSFVLVAAVKAPDGQTCQRLIQYRRTGSSNPCPRAQARVPRRLAPGRTP
ncbi:MAG TPA: DUF817 domain-containing protein [Kineosporiaceae bacterium]|nr:DUF817 domain-containing protein [Kineosporiaceae bacterium]